MGALAAYTHDNKSGKQAGNLYFELNNMLRERGAAARAELVKVWGGYNVMFFMMAAMELLPNFARVVYRGFPHRGTVESKYKIGRPIQWGAFTSTMTDFAAAKRFIDPDKGVIFKITVTNGRDINAYSFFPTEGEILLTPSHRFTVTPAPYQQDGFCIVDMVQNAGVVVIS